MAVGMITSINETSNHALIDQKAALTNRIAEIKNVKDANLIDICLEKKGSKITHFTCFEVTELKTIPKGMVGLTFPEQDYLYYPHQMNRNTIMKSLVKMYMYAKERCLKLDHKQFKIEVSKAQNEIDLYLKLA